MSCDRLDDAYLRIKTDEAFFIPQILTTNANSSFVLNLGGQMRSRDEEEEMDALLEHSKTRTQMMRKKNVA